MVVGYAGKDNPSMHVLALPGMSDTTGAKPFVCYLQSPHTLKTLWTPLKGF